MQLDPFFFCKPQCFLTYYRNRQLQAWLSVYLVYAKLGL